MLACDFRLSWGAWSWGDVSHPLPACFGDGSSVLQCCVVLSFFGPLPSSPLQLFPCPSPRSSCTSSSGKMKGFNSRSRPPLPAPPLRVFLSGEGGVALQGTSAGSQGCYQQSRPSQRRQYRVPVKARSGQAAVPACHDGQVRGQRAGQVPHDGQGRAGGRSPGLFVNETHQVM